MTRPMRILMLTQSYAPIVGGIEHMVEDISGELAKRGHEVAIATLQQPSAEPIGSAEVPAYGLRTSIHSLPGLKLDEERSHAPPAPDPLTTRELRQLAKSFRPDVVHAHDWLIHSYLPLDRSSSPALLLSMHDYGLTCATRRFMYRGNSLCSGPALTKCVRCSCEVYESVAKGAPTALGTRMSERRVRRHVDVFLPVSSAVRDLCRLGPEDTHRVINNFVTGQPAPLGEQPELAELPDEPFIMYFGDVSEEKGVHNLVAAYRELDAPPPLVLIGRQVGELEDAPGVVALGRQPHRIVLEALRRSLFTVAPSIWSDPFPVVALEAAAAGKPTIASRIGGLQDSVVDGETGFLVPPGDRAALSQAMRRLIDDTELRERLGAAANARQAELYTPGTVIPQYEEAYELALEKRRSRRAE
ncbi:MAG TPA: glycosyltransferase family 4 protein [Solirubrobacterales bacterium]|nr:glycosyltransferase family 4 protein [Solirubrobacterales bacterium]